MIITKSDGNSITEHKPQVPKINKKRLTARWTKENGKLICQWIEASDR